jgi:VanZ family protein
MTAHVFLVRSALIIWGARVAFSACVLLTAWGAFAPAGSAQPHLFPWDKAQHFAAYFALTSSAVLAFPRTQLAWLAVWLSISGAVIEVIQALPIVNRDADVWDWSADTLAIGAVMGVIVAAKLRRGSQHSAPEGSSSEKSNSSAETSSDNGGRPD